MSKHIHRYTVPIEWKNFGAPSYNGSGYTPVITGGRITKLRCEVCADEVELVYEPTSERKTERKRPKASSGAMLEGK